MADPVSLLEQHLVALLLKVDLLNVTHGLHLRPYYGILCSLRPLKV